MSRKKRRDTAKSKCIHLRRGRLSSGCAFRPRYAIFRNSHPRRHRRLLVHVQPGYSLVDDAQQIVHRRFPPRGFGQPERIATIPE